MRQSSTLVPATRLGPYVATIPLEAAPPDTLLGKLYQKVKNPDGTLDNIMRVHSPSPRSLETHFELYKQTMKSIDSPLSLAEREIIAVHVSTLNECSY
jgi:alkylhydroperoxidase family enzyme